MREPSSGDRAGGVCRAKHSSLWGRTGMVLAALCAPHEHALITRKLILMPVRRVGILTLMQIGARKQLRHTSDTARLGLRWLGLGTGAFTVSPIHGVIVP